MNVEYMIGLVVLGTAFGAAAYIAATAKRRAIKRVRRAIALLGGEHHLPQRQYQQTMLPVAFASDNYVITALQSARKLSHQDKKNNPWSEEELAAEIIICETFFRLGARDAVAILREANRRFERIPELVNRHQNEQHAFAAQRIALLDK